MPVAASQIFTVLSSLAVANSLPSGLIATEVTGAVCPCKIRTGFAAGHIPQRCAVVTADREQLLAVWGKDRTGAEEVVGHVGGQRQQDLIGRQIPNLGRAIHADRGQPRPITAHGERPKSAIVPAQGSA